MLRFLTGCDTGDENDGTLVVVSDAGGDVDAFVDGGRQPDGDCAWSITALRRTKPMSVRQRRSGLRQRL